MFCKIWSSCLLLGNRQWFLANLKIITLNQNYNSVPLPVFFPTPPEVCTIQSRKLVTLSVPVPQDSFFRIVTKIYKPNNKTVIETEGFSAWNFILSIYIFNLGYLCALLNYYLIPWTTESILCILFLKMNNKNNKQKQPYNF